MSEIVTNILEVHLQFITLVTVNATALLMLSNALPLVQLEGFSLRDANLMQYGKNAPLSQRMEMDET